MLRLASLLRTQGKILTALPSDWARALPTEAPLLDAARWRQVLSPLTPGRFRDGGDHAPALRELVDIVARGLEEAAAIGELLLKGRGLAIWREALTEGPPQALDVTLTSLRLPDDVAPEAAIIWTPAWVQHIDRYFGRGHYRLSCCPNDCRCRGCAAFR
jgi:hypothetical protein